LPNTSGRAESWHATCSIPTGRLRPRIVESNRDLLMKPSNRIFLAVAATAAAVMGVGGLPPASADQDLAIGSGNAATANLNFRVIIPALTRLRIGDPTPGTVNTIQFTLGGAGTPMPGDGTPVGAGNGGSGGYPLGDTSVEVELLTTAGNVTVTQTPTAANLVGLVAVNTIPWTEILIDDNGLAFSHTQTGGSLTSGATPIFTNGPGVYSGNWTFTYNNTTAFAADTYNGTMQYTVINP
jgi:hypothetical protein